MDKVTGSLMRLAAAFPRENIPESTIALYRTKLDPCDPDAIAEVIEAAISNSTRFPSIAELRRDYSTALSRRALDEPEALPLGRAPMPESIKQQIREMSAAFDRRAAEVQK